MIGVVGLGLSGMATISWLKARGLAVHAFDTRDNPPGLAQLPSDVPVTLGPLDAAKLSQCHYLVLSPGLAKDVPAIQDAGVEVLGDVELFARSVEAPVIAITGSNGKSTVTTLVGDMAARAGIKVAVGGNIGVPVLALPMDAELYVLELSSFQLETTSSLKAVAATILNLSPDHLDRYDGMAGYARAKQRIYEHAEHCIYNSDDKATRPAKGGVSFGEQGQYHLADGWLSKGETPLIRSSDVCLLGRHNHFNALAALALGEAAGIPLAAMLESLKHFGGLPHRCEPVADKGGVRFVNDSKATNLGSTEAALDGFADIPGDIILLAGGDAKGADLSPLKARLGKVRELICFGKDGAAIAALKAGCHLVASLDEAVPLAASLAKAGDLVLLSPACASLDQFKNFEARGARFRELVEAL
ncbi:UDP-N-acetylmuramoyl-L-alanine--D-glutamate ligase [Gallaecimonas kandeliae]|uniref:UDP-N-acetylmuramoyl-L-alanine--D-glutamate ligase n=1 Tax=Gallaecimonas kandeliae TaxID=3029055 RepID=UPI002648B23A|nr:UDP-N-acetylmuramoyl-L-alanine--D-glutamate ligase [Gallaecimonas kandeliae]WKE66083.1 UDP-N-acetylmuramoyl-L-alanine--D-glutamate ligase [Gallaecimonas kandeliae]